jgi:hypothetical protein
MATTYAQTEIKIWNGTADTKWYTDSTTASIYRISTAEQLAGLEKLIPNTTAAVSFAGKTIILMNDIMLNDITDWENWGKTPPANTWAPIAICAPYGSNASTTRMFQGTFDGNGYTISGIYISNSTAYQGLFGTVGASGVIKNLGIAYSYIKGGNWSGGLVGRNYGKLQNSFAIRTKVVNGDSKEYIGGLVGINFNANSEVNNTYFAGQVLETDGESHFYGGGIVGNNSGKVSNSYYDGYYDETGNATITRTSGNDSPGTGNGRTTEEMQSQNFADALNNAAGGAFGDVLMNKWVFRGGYPVLLHDEKADNIFNGKFANNNAGTTAATPYIIESSQQLKNLSVLASQVDLRGYYFKLGQNIELPEGIWVPIGSLDKPFNGTFDGNSKTISKIHTDGNLSYQGLFGYIGSNGIVKNIGVIDSDIKGKDYVGGIAGYNADSIGNSYSTAKVSGNNYVGGFAGYNAGIIGIAYSAGEVTGKADVGGFAGYNCESCKIIGGYYNKSINSELSDPRVEGIDETEMKSMAFVKELSNIAAVFEANEWKAVPGGYPVLGNETAKYDLSNYFAEGSGEETNPYLISTPKHLEYVSLLVTTERENFDGLFLKLANDLALSPYKNFTPIGKMTGERVGYSFKGTFDGGNRAISGLYINSNANYGTGLFSHVSGGTLKNLKITNSIVKGKGNVGGLVGFISDEAFIDSCSFSGTVTGTSFQIGGLVGFNFKAEIKDSYSTEKVNGNNAVGGLVGYNSSIIKNSYSASKVTGNSGVGGLVGYNFYGNGYTGNIDNSYFTGSVTGNNNVGGLVGYDYGSIENYGNYILK